MYLLFFPHVAIERCESVDMYTDLNTRIFIVPDRVFRLRWIGISLWEDASLYTLT